MNGVFGKRMTGFFLACKGTEQVGGLRKEWVQKEDRESDFQGHGEKAVPKVAPKRTEEESLYDDERRYAKPVFVTEQIVVTFDVASVS